MERTQCWCTSVTDNIYSSVPLCVSVFRPSISNGALCNGVINGAWAGASGRESTGQRVRTLSTNLSGGLIIPPLRTKTKEKEKERKGPFICYTTYSPLPLVCVYSFLCLLRCPKACSVIFASFILPYFCSCLSLCFVARTVLWLLPSNPFYLQHSLPKQPET